MEILMPRRRPGAPRRLEGIQGLEPRDSARIYAPEREAANRVERMRGAMPANVLEAGLMAGVASGRVQAHVRGARHIEVEQANEDGEEVLLAPHEEGQGAAGDDDDDEDEEEAQGGPGRRRPGRRRRRDRRRPHRRHPHQGTEQEALAAVRGDRRRLRALLRRCNGPGACRTESGKPLPPTGLLRELRRALQAT
eukprot:tig00000492_g1414.t1